MIRDSSRQTLHQLGVRNRVEVLREVRIQHLGLASGKFPMHLLHRLHGAAPGSVPVRLIAQVSFEDGFQDELRCRLSHSISNGWNSQRPLSPSRLRYQHPAYGLGPIGLSLQLFLQLLKPAFLAVLLDVLEALPIDSGCAPLRLRLLERLHQGVPSVNLVVQHVKPVRRLRLGLHVQLLSELFEFYLGC